MSDEDYDCEILPSDEDDAVYQTDGEEEERTKTKKSKPTNQPKNKNNASKSKGKNLSSSAKKTPTKTRGRPKNQQKYEFNQRDISAIHEGITKFGNSWATIGINFHCLSHSYCLSKGILLQLHT